MTPITAANMKIRFFLGTVMTPNLRQELAQSRRWEFRQILGPQVAFLLEEVVLQEKSLVGISFSTDRLDLDQIRAADLWLRKAIRALCPNNDGRQIRPQIYTQTLVS